VEALLGVQAVLGQLLRIPERELRLLHEGRHGAQGHRLRQAKELLPRRFELPLRRLQHRGVEGPILRVFELLPDQLLLHLLL